ncbi:MAG TPA: glycosyltransferase [Gammaproteobacteria bacterium]|nr:glycosyltransferase [Gammaproteobacteria bacterium]
MKIRIDVPVYNRKNITELVLTQLYKTKGPEDQIFIYNDNSTEYDNAWLSQWGKVITYEMPSQDRWRNIHTIRSLAYRDFLINWHKDSNNFDFLYMTDNDAFHDTNWREELLKVYEKTKSPVSGYISSFMFNNYDYYRNHINSLTESKKIRSTGGGISILLDKSQVQYIVGRMGHVNMDDMWDCVTWGYLNNEYAIPVKSYLEHFGKGGLHHQSWDNERAIKPTEYLQNIRPIIIDYLENKVDKSEVLQKI